MCEHDNAKPDLTMELYRAVGERLVSRTTALAIAELIVRDRFGQGELDRQMPLEIRGQDDTWIITGNGLPDVPAGTPSGALKTGSLPMKISQLDGRILNFSLAGYIVP
ncbi:MAG: NTF2 fold immunity protein [Hyphomicrobium sp.]